MAETRFQTPKAFWLPRFCAPSFVFAVMLLAQTVVIIVSLAPVGAPGQTLQRLFTGTLFSQWLAVVSCAVLCVARPWLAQRSPALAATLSYLAVLLLTAVSSLLVAWMDHAAGLGLTVARPRTWQFVWGNTVICAVVVAAAMRYFYLVRQHRQQELAQAQARFDALQARIRPHFLFNSMNTIASLIMLAPKQAEAAVLDLADLFRDSLSRGGQWITLGEEVALVKRYLRIEKLRLGERLQVDWQLQDAPEHWRLPALMLQPLVENAIYHGVQTLPEGGTVIIRAQHNEKVLQLVVINPVSAVAGRETGEGNQIAQHNIRQRLALAFGDAGGLATATHDGHYQATLRIPRQARGDEQPDRDR